jgi:hypothetical protein
MIITDNTTKMQKICLVYTVKESIETGFLPENIILAQELFFK